MKKKFKSLCALLMAAVMMVSTSTLVSAAEKECAVNDDVIESVETASARAVSTPYYRSGTCNISFSDVVNVTSTKTYSIAITTRGSGTAWFFVYNPNTTRYYVSQNINANGTGYSWNMTLPAGTYEVGMIGSSGTYSYTVSIR